MRGESGADAIGKGAEEKRCNMERRRKMQRSKYAKIGVKCHSPLKNTEIL